MARHNKIGLDYFSFDVDFYDNKKVRKIMRACGPATGSILSCLLCNIYKWKGYYSQWDQDLPFDIADTVGVSEGAVLEVVTKALQVDFFDQDQFDRNKILTSHEIQNRYKQGTAKRIEVVILDEYLINDVGKQINVGRNEDNGDISTQSKVKESIVNDSKVGPKGLVVNGSSAETNQLKKEYEELVKSLDGKDKATVWTSIRDFIRDKRPRFFEPYMDAWNVFAIGLKIIEEPQRVTPKRVNKFKTRITEPGFDYLKILEKVKTSTFMKGNNNNNWKVGIEFILESEENYTKILEGKYDH